MMVGKIKCGVLGTGKITTRFAQALNNIPEHAELLAVGSRNQETADALGDKFNIPRRYTSYEDVAKDPDIDIIYIGTPGVYHLRDASMALNHGKHVLCEKAFTINVKEAQEMVDLAREKNLFLMEAMWTRFFPIHVRIRELLADEVLGKVNGVTVNFLATAPFDLNNRFFDINLGASVLLDTASYGVSWSSSLFGEPEAVTGLATIGESGADYQVALVLRYKEGQLASLMSSQISYDEKDAILFGEKGKIVIHSPWYKPETMTLYLQGKEPELITLPLGGYNGYEYEAMEVMNCIKAGKTESDIMPLNETISIMKTLDTFRDQWGHKFPFED
ncbi:MAG: Gfo/Idh/MocA family oxidoreductase [Anaerolineales bacterium]|nr:Gfo/Idh/MocA family oxidoreductase [Anaerolineales bacterium]